MISFSIYMPLRREKKMSKITEFFNKVEATKPVNSYSYYETEHWDSYNRQIEYWYRSDEHYVEETLSYKNHLYSDTVAYFSKKERG